MNISQLMSVFPGKSALFKRLRFATPTYSLDSESETGFDDELSIRGIGGQHLESKLDIISCFHRQVFS